MLFVPFLNSFVDSISRKSIETCIVISIVLFSVWPTIYPEFANNTYSYILWMALLFVIGRCLNKYDYNLPWKTILFFSFITLWLCLFLIEPLTPYDENRIINLQYSLPILIIPICMIKIFSKFCFQNRAINWLSKSTFAVYIIHDDPYVRNYIWSQVFHNQYYGMSDLLPLHFVCTVLIIYFSCVSVDKVLRMTLFKLVDKFPLLKTLESKINGLYEKM